MLRKPNVRLVAMLMSVVSVAITALTVPAVAGASQRIDMKVLVLGTSTTEPDLVSWQSALQREGVPFETIITSSGHAPITAATLSSTLSNGTQEAKYQAVIVSVAALPICETTCTSTLSQTEWTALEEYEQTFNVRQITGDTFPGAAYGLNGPTTSGALDGVQGTLTTEGSTIFPYLKGVVKMDVGTFGYEATPLATQVAGASFSPLLAGPGGSALVGVYTHPNGIQEMVETFNQNANQLQAELLRHGALNWVTRGVYFGDQRNYYEAHIDDNFLADDSWNTTTHATDFTPADAIREVPADVEYAANWAATNKFRIDMLFNGGGSTQYAEEHGGTDPLLTAFVAHKSSFGWVSHTWDHPNIDIGCATQSYIEAELNQNNAWATSALGLTASTEPTAAYGNNNPSVIVTGEHSGLANLIPGNPGAVDPPDLDTAEATETGGTLPAGTYVYAVTDDFTPGGGQSLASQSAPVTVNGTTGAVTLTWAAVCHAAEFKIYREVSGSNEWKLIGTSPSPTEAPPNSWFGNPTVNTSVTGGGALEQTFTDTGAAGTASSGPPAGNLAVETAYPENPNLAAAFAGVGVQYFGSDASKPYPDPTIAGSTTPAYQAGESFLDGSARSIPRYPTNVYYNVSTEAQLVDEYNQLYTPVAEGGKCVASPTNTCETKPANFAEIVASVDTNMFQHVMGNDPRPHYFHQPNLMGSPPAGPPTTGTPPATSPSVGDGLFYSVLNPLLEQYNQYFNAPIEQLTVAQIGQLLAEQQVWSKASTNQVSGYIEGNKVTIQNSGATAVNTPLTGVTGVGAAYGGIQSGWTSAPPAASSYTAATTWPTTPEPVQQEPQGSWIGKVGSAGYLLANGDGTQDLSNMPGVTATLLQGTRNQWAANTSDVRALQGPDGLTRDAAAYNDSKEIRVQLSFNAPYSGNLHLYAVDWSKAGRRETVTADDGSGPRTVLIGSDFSQGAWVSFPVNVPAGGKVTLAVTRTVGLNAVLSGLFLGDAGAPPAISGQELSKGGWVGAVGAAGYVLADWDGMQDVADTPGVTTSLVQGTRYRWVANTTDGRALSDPGQTTRNAALYYNSSQIRLQLNFASAYSGNIHLYALDWSKENRRETITVNGQTAVLSSDFSQGGWVSLPINVGAGGTATITVDRTAGVNAVLSGIFLGDAGTPPMPTVSKAPQGAWTGQIGSAGYLLANWDGSQDLSYLPGVTASLQQGARNSWAGNTGDLRALQGPDGLIRDAGAYNDPNQIRVQLSFAAAYTGNLHLYAIDWTKLGRRETVTVNGQTALLSSDFSEGVWMTFPISVAAGGTVTITVDRIVGVNAVLSGIFLGDAGPPPVMPVSNGPQGNWVGAYGSTGYSLAGWEGSAGDLGSLPGVSLSLAQGSRYLWSSNTTDVRALQSPNGLSRNAATYTDYTQIRVSMSFSAAYNGTLRLYALDWSKIGRRELITVNGQTAALSNDFSQGAWVSFPINVPATGTVTITVDRTGGLNSVLSGIFLG